MITITLNKIRAHSPCATGWQKLLGSKGKTSADDEEFPLTDVLDSNGLDDTLWCLQCLPERSRMWRLHAVWCARQVAHLMTDDRSLNALRVAENHANGLATDEELAAAWDAARAAAWAAAWDVARAAARAAAGAAAWDAAWDAARAAAGEAARAAQKAKLRQILEAGEWVE